MGCLLLTWCTLLYIYTYIHNIYIIHNVFAIVFKSKHKVYQIISLPKIGKHATALNFGEKQNQVLPASDGEFMFARLEDVKKRALLCEINLASILMQFHTKLPRTALKL